MVQKKANHCTTYESSAASLRVSSVKHRADEPLVSVRAALSSAKFMAPEKAQVMGKGQQIQEKQPKDSGPGAEPVRSESSKLFADRARRVTAVVLEASGSGRVRSPRLSFWNVGQTLILKNSHSGAKNKTG